MHTSIEREEAVHGSSWNTLHGGYFSDPVVAEPLIQTVLEYDRKSNADVIVDLGCGTGTMLALMLARDSDLQHRLVGIDASEQQLEEVRKSGIPCLKRAIDIFDRRDLGEDACRFLFMMRSVLHYGGQDGWHRMLRHLRAQMRTGEYFVHQSASFLRAEDAACMNELYRMMESNKWYPTVACLQDRLRAKGWEVVGMFPAAALPLTQDELARRYALSPSVCWEIRTRFATDPSVSDHVFKATHNGFCAYLHYWIYACRAVDYDTGDAREGR
jgi:SAM-dependent methyltransferase